MSQQRQFRVAHCLLDRTFQHTRQSNALVRHQFVKALQPWMVRNL
jgi:hypothetical protein